MSAVLARPTNEEEKYALADWLARYVNDPLGFVLAAFTWGEKDTPLENEDGPDVWQVATLDNIGKQLRAGRKVIRFACASGMGAGKTSLMAWVILWFESCHSKSKCVVTANTLTQLSSKTWRELAKWHQLMINSWMFKWTATQLKSTISPNTWVADAIPWSINRSEAFAGTHEDNVLICFDEASAIDDEIWETIEGAQTTSCIWLVFGNMTRNSGRFRACFGKFRHRWTTMRVDTRSCKKANQTQIAEWLEDYGEDNDFFRVRVRGLPPMQGPKQFISSEVVRLAQERVIEDNTIPASVPVIMGVDVAREGDDSSVIITRRGRKMNGEIKRYHEKNLMTFAGYVGEQINRMRPKAVFIDVVGMGAGVYDRLLQLGFTNVIPVHAGATPDDKDTFYNKRIEMWARMKQWLVMADIPANDKILPDDLTGPEYHYDAKSKMRLERKEDMKARGLASPDVGDALAMTFSYAVPEAVEGAEAPEPDDP